MLRRVAVAKRVLKPTREEMKPQTSLSEEEVPGEAVAQCPRDEQPVEVGVGGGWHRTEGQEVHDDVEVAAAREESDHHHHPEDPRPERHALVPAEVPPLLRHFPHRSVLGAVPSEHGHHHEDTPKPYHHHHDAHLDEALTEVLVDQFPHLLV